MDEEENGGSLEEGEGFKGDSKGTSKMEQITSSISNKMEKIQNEFKQEVKEEIEEHGAMIDNAKDTATELVNPETIDKFITIIKEKPVHTGGVNKKLWCYIVWKLITSVCLKLLDIGTDIAAAAEHFERRDWLYGALTLFFVYLPGFVLSAAFAIWGLLYKKVDGTKKEVTLERLGRYTLLLFVFPLAYPIIQIALALLMVILMIRRRDKEPKKFMGHDLNQFKSLEGFLESGPSFCLQTYILMLGHYKGTNIDWHNINMDDLERVGLLSLSSLMSFINLTKTAYKVNVPDPDIRRRQKQYPDNAKYFKLTLLLFNITCILYRLIGISYFYVYLRNYAILVIFAGYIVNLIAFICGGAVPTISMILSAISLFVPNGYLLHNFAGTLEVDLTESGSKIVFLTSTIGVNIIWAGGVAAIYALIGSDLEWILRRDIFFSENNDLHLNYILWLNSILGVLGLLSLSLGILHWYASVRKIFRQPDQVPVEENELNTLET